MPRVGHYLRRNASGGAPTRIMVVDTETVPIPLSFTLVEHELAFGWCAYVRRRAPGHWSQPQWHRFTTVGEFAQIVGDYLDVKTRLTLVSHNAAYDAMVLDAWNVMPGMGLSLKKAILESPPFCCEWRGEQGSVRWVDTLNFYTMSLASLGTYVGLDKLDMPTSWNDTELADTYCKRDCEITLRAFEKWVDFCHEHDLGVVALSRAGQAFNAFKHRFMEHQILIDTHDRALDSARASYYGGRVECFKVGKYETSLYKLDINSMYPAIMHKEDFPTTLRTFMTEVTLSGLRKYLQEYAIVASCLIDTDEPVYPYRAPDRLYFPIGEFSTYLTGPELIYGLTRGHVKRVYTCNIYDKAPIFTSFVEYFYTERLKAKDLGDTVTDLNLKLLMNSLYGKFGQRGRRYEETETMDDWRIGSEIELDLETGRWFKVRYLGHIVQRQVGESESGESHPAIAAYVTGYGRVQLWTLIRTAGVKNVFYCDTDSLIVNKTGYDRLTPYLHDTELGKLKLEAILDWIDLRGPKDYAYAGEEKIKGIRHDASWVGTNLALQEKWYGVKAMLSTGRLHAPMVEMHTKQLDRTYRKGHVSPSGEVLPFVLPRDETLL